MTFQVCAPQLLALDEQILRLLREQTAPLSTYEIYLPLQQHASDYLVVWRRLDRLAHRGLVHRIRPATRRVVCWQATRPEVAG